MSGTLFLPINCKDIFIAGASKKKSRQRNLERDEMLDGLTKWLCEKQVTVALKAMIDLDMASKAKI